MVGTPETIAVLWLLTAHQTIAVRTFPTITECVKEAKRGNEELQENGLPGRFICQPEGLQPEPEGPRPR